MFKINEKDIKQEVDESDLLEDIYMIDGVSVKQEHQEILHVKEENLSETDNVTEKIDFDYQIETINVKEEHLEIEFVNFNESDLNESKNESDVNWKNDTYSNKTEEKVHIYNCDECNFETSVKAFFVQHQHRHTEERNYLCNYCQYSTHKKKHLKFHNKAKHSQRITYNCDRCTYISRTKKNLMLHKRNFFLKNKGIKRCI